MESAILGNGNYTINKVVNKLKTLRDDYAELIQKWEAFHGYLELGNALKYEVGQKVLIGTLQREEIIRELLSKWKASKGKDATMKKIHDALLSCELKPLADLIKEMCGDTDPDRAAVEAVEALPELKLEEPVKKFKQDFTSKTKHDGAKPEADEYVHKSYKMTAKSRGKVVIFNHRFSGVRERHGTEQDEKSLRAAFIKCGFRDKDILTESDLKLVEFKSKIKAIAREDHSNRDCLVICVLTHGEEDKISCSDGLGYEPQYLWKKFEADKCRTLAGKPKLFFIQACRGDGTDSGSKVDADGCVGSKTDLFTKIPNEADFLVMFSTPNGKRAYRDTKHGSWFIQTLCDVIVKYKCERDLLSMMSVVTGKVRWCLDKCLPGKTLVGCKVANDLESLNYSQDKVI